MIYLFPGRLFRTNYHLPPCHIVKRYSSTSNSLKVRNSIDISTDDIMHHVTMVLHNLSTSCSCGLVCHVPPTTHDPPLANENSDKSTRGRLFPPTAIYLKTIPKQCRNIFLLISCYSTPLDNI